MGRPSQGQVGMSVPAGNTHRSAGTPARWILIAALLGTSCGDSLPPAAPPPPVERDHVGSFTASPPALDLRAPAAAGLRFVVVSLAYEADRVTAQVAIRNDGPSLQIGPDGVAVFDAPAPIAVPDSLAICDRADTTAVDLPPAACLFDHRGTYGGDGLLSPGETSAPAAWVWRAHGDFTFRARPVFAGLASSGEISGVVFEDRDGDGRRGLEPSMPGRIAIAGAGVDTSVVAGSDGRWRFQAERSGEYRLALQADSRCCPTLATALAIHIGRLEDGTLRGYGRADFGCGAGSPPPAVVFLETRAAGIEPCASAAPCTIPAQHSFRIRLTGSSGCGSIAGFAWRGIAAGGGDSVRWQPFGDENVFLPAQRDTFGLSAGGDTLWRLERQVLSVIVPHTRTEPLPSGVFRMQARVQDAFGRVSSRGERRLVLNFDPQTELARTAACDCPVPPPDCPQRDSTTIGWVVGFGPRYGDLQLPREQWMPFCDGDTLPQWSIVRFVASGRDDRRDAPRDSLPENRELRYSFRFAWRSGEVYGSNMIWSPPIAATDEILPGGATRRGAAAGWSACPMDYVFYAAGVDEHDRWDGTPDSLRFFASGAPGLDSVICPQVVVLAPSFGGSGPIAPFGRDTLLVLGQHLPDLEDPPRTPFRLGFDSFVLPYAAWGRDHPRDRDRRYFSASTRGRIRAWYHELDCDEPGCQDVLLPYEHHWIRNDTRDDVLDQQYFHVEPLVVPYDTVCTTHPCRLDSLRVVLTDAGISGRYRFRLQARDTEPGDFCDDLFDLGPIETRVRRWIGDSGRRSQLFAGTTTLRLLYEVRPTPASRAP